MEQDFPSSHETHLSELRKSYKMKTLRPGMGQRRVSGKTLVKSQDHRISEKGAILTRSCKPLDGIDTGAEGHSSGPKLQSG